MATATTFRAARRPYDREAQERQPRQTTRFVGRVQYDGTEYVGWQTQPSGRGVQDVLEARLSSLLGGRVYVAGSGRTDKGVHARDQVFHFETPAQETDDAAVASVLERAGFHARDSYVYTVEEGIGSPFGARYRHDFSAFGVRRPDDPRPPTKDDGGDGGGGVVIITAESDRFLYNMMRLLSGTLVQAAAAWLAGPGRGLDELTLRLAEGRHGSLVVKAPPHGLCLERCFLDYEHEVLAVAELVFSEMVTYVIR
ncbi:putative tRNA-pseudouridine synthase [Emiliania huxleyi CCMP1516]|uniref:tRNA pseudouridine synthase n=2 Tax=Emiliania huxleyi TaxID=2903 RepID=A0A0D3KI76_EMIH1|nr:putative tRNA-pseudouridine synthase [Emiliania huxleyi CCMP1516]EOD35461.1 putative tRNA-pseudouridine synthase [Emiliania huxleyi CCMP1516]|eukprot:XP_005787890.1 putative tRNA-pseudouridine synthase [Emiliania huxleyi CCMP1516]